MIGAEMSAFFKMLKYFKYASSNSKGTSLAKRFVRGLAIYEKSFYEAVVKTSMAKKIADPSDIYRS
jgi:histidyl-tRNA synthetase